MEKNCCDVCGASGDLKICSRCKDKKYCSVQCQSCDWPIHKFSCKSIEISVNDRIKTNPSVRGLVEEILTYISLGDHNYFAILNVIIIYEDLRDKTKDIILFAVFIGNKALEKESQKLNNEFPEHSNVDKLPIFIHKSIQKIKVNGGYNYKCTSVSPLCVGIDKQKKQEFEKCKDKKRKGFLSKYGFSIEEFEKSECMLILEGQKLSIVEDETNYKKIVSMVTGDSLLI